MVPDTTEFLVREDDGVIIVDVSGKIIGEQAARFKRSLDRTIDGVPSDLAPALVVCLKRVAFLDSEGLGAIVRARQAVVQRGGRFVLAEAGENIRRLLTVAKLTEILPNYEREADAVAALAG
jgi:anti-anti-sigma factor